MKKVHLLKFFNSTVFNYIICFSIFSAFLLEASNICSIRCRLQLCYGENGFIFILLIFIYMKSLQQLHSLRMWHCYISLQLVKHGLNRSKNPSSGKQVEIFKKSKSVEILSSIAALGAKALASIQHQVFLADQQCWTSNLSFSCWMLVLVTFGLPLNVLFPKQKGHTMKGEVCITCFNAEALQDQRGPYLPFSTLPRLSRLNFVLHVDAHLQGLQRDRLQSHLLETPWTRQTAQPRKGSPAQCMNLSWAPASGLGCCSSLSLFCD